MTDYSEDPTVTLIGGNIAPVALIMAECRDTTCGQLHLAVNCELCDGPGAALCNDTDLFDFVNDHTMMCIEVHADRFQAWRQARHKSFTMYSGAMTVKPQ